jgi:hypothetical protein
MGDLLDDVGHDLCTTIIVLLLPYDVHRTTLW